jgi:hypothetical protein
MGYERLTERVGKGIAVKQTSKNDNKSIFNAIERLAELEDKIEQGTLVDTEGYFIVEENQWAGKNRYLVCQNAVQLAVCDFCETKEKAEEVIKELQNG